MGDCKNICIGVIGGRDSQRLTISEMIKIQLEARNGLEKSANEKFNDIINEFDVDIFDGE